MRDVCSSIRSQVSTVCLRVPRVLAFFTDFVIAMAPKSAMSLLAAELPEFDVEHGLAGADLGELDELPLLDPPSSIPAVRAQADASAAAPLSKAPPSTPSIVRPKKDATLEDIFIQLSLPERLRAPLLGLLGADPTDDAETLSALTWEMFQTDVVAQLVFEDGAHPTIFEKSRLFRFYKDLVKIFADEPLRPPPPAPPVQPVHNITVTIPEKGGHPMREFIDQTSTERFAMLSDSEIAELRARYFKITGMQPLPEERPTDEQLSALGHLLRNKKEKRINAPFVEFAVFGNYDGRSAKLRQFTGQVFDREGTLVARTLRAPQSFSAWDASWQVYAVALIMYDVASPGALRAYHQGIRKLADFFPNEWPTIAMLDEEMRAERWSRLRQEYADGTRTPPSDYNPAEPWKTIVRDTRFGFLGGPLADWWREHERTLERSLRGSKSSSSSSSAPPVFPSHVGNRVLAEVAANPKVTTASPTPFIPRTGRKRNFNNVNNAQNNRKQPQPQPKKQKLTCWICDSPNHLQKDCPKGRGKGGKNGKGGKGRGKGGKSSKA